MELEPGTFSLPEALENGLTMVRERAGKNKYAVLTNPVNIGIGTK